MHRLQLVAVNAEKEEVIVTVLKWLDAGYSGACLSSEPCISCRAQSGALVAPVGASPTQCKQLSGFKLVAVTLTAKEADSSHIAVYEAFGRLGGVITEIEGGHSAESTCLSYPSG